MNQAVKIAEIAGCRLFAVHPATPELEAYAGCRLFAVHPATPELEAYYAKYGFVRTVTTPMIMVLPLRKIRTTLAAVAAAQAGTDRQL
jgi:hypothetical protein